MDLKIKEDLDSDNMSDQEDKISDHEDKLFHSENKMFHEEDKMFREEDKISDQEDKISNHISPPKRRPGRPPLPDHLKKQRALLRSPASSSSYSGRPRGRPRAYQINEFGDKVRIKRTVGRPPRGSRNLSDINVVKDISDSEEAKSDFDSSKRSRGRPPKSPLTSTEKKLLVKFQKRRPGRPPNPDKQRSAAPSSLTPGLKRRGRPPGALNKIRRPRWQTPILTESVHTMADPDNTILRLTGRHFPEVLSVGTNLCQVCFNNNKEMETAFCCADCGGNPPLCAYPCFGIYHTVFRYWQPELMNGPSLASKANLHNSEDQQDSDDNDEGEEEGEEEEEEKNDIDERENGENDENDDDDDDDS